MAATYAGSSDFDQVDGNSLPRRPLYGGFDPSQWSIDPTGATTPAKPNTGIPVSHHFHSPQIAQSPYSDDRKEPLYLSSIPQKLRMKGRPRGESDLSRPSVHSHNPSTNGFASIPHGAQQFTVVEETHMSYESKRKTALLTAILVPLPFLFSSLLVTPAFLQKRSDDKAKEEGMAVNEVDPLLSALQACALASGTLLAVYAFSRLWPANLLSSSQKYSKDDLPPKSIPLSLATLKLVLMRIACVLFPFMAVTALGGTRTAMILLAGVAAGIICPEVSPSRPGAASWRSILRDRKWTCFLFVLSFIADISLKGTDVEYATIIRGYLVLVKAALFVHLPLPTLFPSSSRLSGSGQESKTVIASNSISSAPAGTPVSILIATPLDANFTLVAGGLLCVITAMLSFLFKLEFSVDILHMILFFTTVSLAAGLLISSRPLALRSHRRSGLALGTLLVMTAGWFHDFHTKSSALMLGIFSGLTYVAVHFDTPIRPSRSNHEKVHDDSASQHHYHRTSNASDFTKLMLQQTEGWPLMHSVLASKDSRSIFYFLLINFAFMLIQLFYSIVTESLGLMSDSIHMFFDCFGMLVGLFAAVMTKWPASDRFPYGFGKVNTLSGFANGVFLIFVSIEFIWDSFERFVDGVQLKRLEELFVVSVLGLIVNLIGLKLTHGHHGHSHGHDHSQSHHHIHVDGSQDEQQGDKKSLTPHSTQHSHHIHQHGDENMLGIYLHILADTMGSVAVIFSTALTYLTGYYFWDPLASCIIAVLIMAASYPLVRDSAKRLLLTVPDNIEWKIREALQELSGLRGVVGYGGPRFWVSDSEDATAINGHIHTTDHKHNHEHESDHLQGLNSDAVRYETALYQGDKIFGVIHVIAARGSDLEDVRTRTCQFLQDRNMDVVVHVEREGVGRCWCGGDKNGGGIGMS